MISAFQALYSEPKYDTDTGAIYLRDVDGKEYIIGTYCNIKYNNIVY